MLGFFYVVHGEASGFDQLRHYGLSAASEEAEEFVDESALRGVARYDRFEDVGVADFFYAAHGFSPPSTRAAPSSSN